MDNQEIAKRYKNVFLGKVPTNRDRKISLNYISKRLSREGFFTVTPKIKGGQNFVLIKRGPEKAVVVKDNTLESESTPRSETKSLETLHRYWTINQTIKRGSILNKEHLKLVEDKKIVRNAVKTQQFLIGKKIKKTLRKGTILTSHHIYTPPLIEKGEDVKLIIRQSGIEISGIAKALSNGMLGDMIKVRRKRVVMDAKITGTKQVEIENI